MGTESPPSYTLVHLEYITMATLYLFPFHVQLLSWPPFTSAHSTFSYHGLLLPLPIPRSATMATLYLFPFHVQLLASLPIPRSATMATLYLFPFHVQLLASLPIPRSATMATLYLCPCHVQLLACKLWVAMVIYSKMTLQPILGFRTWGSVWVCDYLSEYIEHLAVLCRASWHSWLPCS